MSSRPYLPKRFIHLDHLPYGTTPPSTKELYLGLFEKVKSKDNLILAFDHMVPAMTPDVKKKFDGIGCRYYVVDQDHSYIHLGFALIHSVPSSLKDLDITPGNADRTMRTALSSITELHVLNLWFKIIQERADIGSNARHLPCSWRYPFTKVVTLRVPSVEAETLFKRRMRNNDIPGDYDLKTDLALYEQMMNIKLE